MPDRPPLRAPVSTDPGRRGPVPRVSVLVPAYNAADTIGESLESAFSQRPAPEEVIVSDDGSEDELSAALAPFASRLRVIRGPNAGLAVARNRAAEVATGELLCLLDADDVWLPGRVAALKDAAARRPDLSILTTDAVESRDGVLTAGTYYGIRTFATEEQEVAILRSNFIFGAGAVRAGAFWSVGGYRPGTRYAEDWDLWVRLLLSGHRAGLVDEPLYEYRRRADSLTGRTVDLGLGVLELLTRAAALDLTPAQRQQLRLTRQEWRRTVASAAYRNGDPRGRGQSLLAAGGAGLRPGDRLRLAAKALLPRRRQRVSAR